MTQDKIIRDQAALYRRSFREHGDSPDATFNSTRPIQHLRFERLIAGLPDLERRFSIHDVGAGLCDLHAYLLDRGIDHEYSGTEIVQEMIDLSSQKYPDIRLSNRDLLRDDASDTYDHVVLSGVFNIPGSADHESWRRFVLAMIEKMYGMADVAIAFNFLSTHRTFTDPTLFYLDPLEVFQLCLEKLSRFVRLDHAYPFYECTVTVLKPQTVRATHDSAVFDKYFR